MTTTDCELKFDKAIFAYARANADLWALIQEHPNYFPRGVISCGSIAELYTLMYLKRLRKTETVKYGRSNEKAWDLEVLLKGGKLIKYQVKAVSPYNKSRRITNLVTGFDYLIVMEFEECFFPTNVYLFEDAKVFLTPKKIKTLTVPDLGHASRCGSAVFRYARNIKDEFWEALE